MCPRDPVGYVAGGLLPTGRVYHGTEKEPFRRLLRVTRAPPGGRPGESAQDTVPGGQPLAHGPSLGTAPRGDMGPSPFRPTTHRRGCRGWVQYVLGAGQAA